MKEELNVGLLDKLKVRFFKNMKRHPHLDWSLVEARLKDNGSMLQILEKMENTGGEPDIIAHDEQADVFIFADCSPETPLGRRSLCYDQEALNSRKENKPVSNAIEMAASIGIELLPEALYREMQKHDEYDKKTSSWIQTPHEIRERGGALFCDRRYGQVFTYHNGAESYYAARGFRGSVKV